ncbi:hypothetical protein Tco_1147966 [Tanacetum coccineum]
MDLPAHNINNSTIRSILDKEKLTGPNFMDWYRNLRIVLRAEKKLVDLEQPLPPTPLPVEAQGVRDAYTDLYDAQLKVVCLMLVNVSLELQKSLKKHNAFDLLQEMKTRFEEEGKSVSSYILEMKGYLDNLECLGYPMPQELRVSLILNSLSKDYGQFVQNYNMHCMGKTMVELHAMLKLFEKGIPKKVVAPAVLAIRGGKIQKKKKNKPQGAMGKGNGRNRECDKCWGEEDGRNRCEAFVLIELNKVVHVNVLTD